MRRVLLTVAVGAALALAQHDPAPGASSSAPIDITSQVLGGANVTLTGDSVINLPPGTTTYNGVLSGQGTLTVRAPSGPGTLILSKDSDFTLPDGRRRQSVTTTAGPHPVTTVSNPDPPAITVAAGATLWYGNGGSAGVIGQVHRRHHGVGRHARARPGRQRHRHEQRPGADGQRCALRHLNRRRPDRQGPDGHRRQHPDAGRAHPHGRNQRANDLLRSDHRHRRRTGQDWHRNPDPDRPRHHPRRQQGTLTMGSGATIDAGAFTQSPGTTLALTIGPSTAGAQPAPINVDGTVHLAGTLTLNPGPAAPPTPGQKLTLIHTTGIAGTFTGLPEGATLATGGGTYQITYTGGTGHEVVLTVLHAPPPTSAAPAQQAQGGGTPPPQAMHGTAPAGSGSPRTLAVAGAATAAAALGLLVVVLKRRRRDQAE